MEDITYERLISNFDDVLAELNSIRESKEAILALIQISSLVDGSQKIELEKFDEEGKEKDSEHDHVLHKLLDKMQSMDETIWVGLDDVNEIIKRLEDNKTKEINDAMNKIISDPEYKDSKKKAELDEKFNAKKQEIENKYNSIKKQIEENFPESSLPFMLDIGQKAREIGTEVFKTADIRKELLERIQKGEAEPEKLKGFYEIGKYNAEVIFGDTKKKKDKLENAYSEVINDENSKNLREMLDEATTDKERISICEKIRKKLIADDKFKDYLEYKNANGDVITDFSSSKIKNIADVNLFLNHVLIYIDRDQKTDIDLKNAYNTALKEESASSLKVQLDETIKKNNISEKIRICEEIRKKIFKNPKFEDFQEILKIEDKIGNVTKTVDFYNDGNEIIDEVNADYLIKALKQIEERISSYKEIMEEQEENMMVFQRELDIFDIELTGQEVYEEWYDGDNLKKEKEDELNEEIETRKKQIEVSMYGDEEYEKRWNKTVERFCKCRDESGEASREITYTDKNGVEQKINVKFKTIDKDKYPTNDKEEEGDKCDSAEEQYEKDIRFLNIREYKKYLELTSLFENLGKDDNGNDTLTREQKLDLMSEIIKQGKLNDFAPELLKKYREKEIEKRGSGKEWLDTYLGECKEYVTTFNGFTNKYAVQYSVLKTAGSMMKAMEPIKGDLPASQKAERRIKNFFRFLGFRSIKDAETMGQKARIIAMNCIKGAGLFGIVTAAATGFALGPVTGAGMLITGASYYVAKGTVWLANIGDSKRIYKKYKEQIDSNLPTLTKATEREKEVMRRHYYMSKDGMGPIRAWFKAKVERVRKKAREETEQKILEAKYHESEASILGRAEQIKKNKDLADENQKKRLSNIEAVARSSATYNDIAREPDNLDDDSKKDEAFRNIVLNAALHSNGKSQRLEVNTGSEVEYKGKYTREGIQLEKTQELGEVKEDSVAIPVMTIAQKFKAQQESQDFMNVHYGELREM